jgi:hypothetical protein
MASEVGICNMAASHIGEDGVVVSIQPADGSVLAGHCARFYAIARDDMLELFQWAFAAKRQTLAPLVNDTTEWSFKFATPSDCLKARRLIPLGATTDHKGVDYLIEGDALYTDEETPTLLYTKRVTDTTKFTTLFTSAVSYKLASYISGPIVKKPTVTKTLLDMALQIGSMGAANEANANSQETHDSPAPWMAARGVTMREDQPSE